MTKERRRDERVETTSIIGLLRNLSQKTEAQPATIENLSRGGFLVETFLKAKLHDAVEFRVEGLSLAGEVIHYHQEGDRSRIGVRIQYPLDHEELQKILQPFQGQ